MKRQTTETERSGIDTMHLTTHCSTTNSVTRGWGGTLAAHGSAHLLEQFILANSNGADKDPKILRGRLALRDVVPGRQRQNTFLDAPPPPACQTPLARCQCMCSGPCGNTRAPTQENPHTNVARSL